MSALFYIIGKYSSIIDWYIKHMVNDIGIKYCQVT